MRNPIQRRAALAAMLLLAACADPPLDAQSLERSINALDAAAHETQTLLRLAAQGSVPSRFLRVQCEEIAKIVDDAARPLHADPAPGLAWRAARARALSEKLSGALASRDSAAAAAIAAEFEALSKGAP